MTILAQITLVILDILSYIFQLSYGSKFNTNIGMLDGENCERLWSYIRKFIPITKEQTGDHRRHLLSEALGHFAAKNVRKLSKFTYV